MALTTDYAKPVIYKSGIERNRKKTIASGPIAPRRSRSPVAKPRTTQRTSPRRYPPFRAAGVTMSHACESFAAGFTCLNGRKRSLAPVIRVASMAPSVYRNNLSDRSIRHFQGTAQ